MTLTEALGKIKTIDARIEKKKQTVMEHLLRPAALVDPLAASGGQELLVQGELQAIKDLLEYKLALKTAINQANQVEYLTIMAGPETITMSIAEWLMWKRYIAPIRIDLLNNLLRKISNQRDEFVRRMAAQPGQQSLIVNVDEAKLAQQLELVVQVFGEMDGQLSLRNSTAFCDVEYQVVE
jgi:hypothetical protein